MYHEPRHYHSERPVYIKTIIFKHNNSKTQLGYLLATSSYTYNTCDTKTMFMVFYNKYMLGLCYASVYNYIKCI